MAEAGDEQGASGEKTTSGNKASGGKTDEKKPGPEKGAGQGTEPGDKDHPEQPESTGGGLARQAG